MIELLIALVGVLNIAVGALAWQIRRNGTSNNANNGYLRDAVKLLYSIEGKLNTLVETQQRVTGEDTIWRGEVRENYKEIAKGLADIPKRSEFT